MNRTEVAALLAVAALYDRRVVGKSDVEGWLPFLAGISYDAAHRAVLAHYEETRDWLTPNDVLGRIKAERGRRVEAEFEYVPGDPDEPVDVYLARRRQQIANVAAGRPQVDRAPAPALRQRDVGALVAGISRDSRVPAGIREGIALRRHPAMEVHCPACRARPGAVCQRGDGSPLGRRMHPSRIDAWAVVSSPCPECRAAAGAGCLQLGQPYGHGAHRGRVDAAGADLEDAR